MHQDDENDPDNLDDDKENGDDLNEIFKESISPSNQNDNPWSFIINTFMDFSLAAWGLYSPVSNEAKYWKPYIFSVDSISVANKNYSISNSKHIVSEPSYYFGLFERMN